MKMSSLLTKKFTMEQIAIALQLSVAQGEPIIFKDENEFKINMFNTSIVAHIIKMVKNENVELY